MKIAYVNADRGIPVYGDKGATVHVREMIGAFAAAGCEVRLLAALMGDGAPGGVAADVEIVNRRKVARDAPQEDRERALIALSGAVEERLVALHREWPFDAIYERYSLWSTAGVNAAARLGVPVIVEVNAPLIQEQAAYRKLALAAEAEAIEREVFARASRLAVVSAPLRDYVVGRGARPEAVEVLGNAVDATRFHPDAAPAALDLADDAFVIGFTGSLKQWHGIDTLLEAFRRVRSRAPAAHLLIVGDGPMLDWAKGFAADAGLSDHVTMTGWAPHDALPGLIARMNVATAPYPEMEGFYFSPLKLFEYLAIGRPVVASRIGQVAEVVEDGVSGLLVTPGDAEALAAALLSLIDDPAQAAALAKGAAVEGARHTWARNAARVMELARASAPVG